MRSEVVVDPRILSVVVPNPVEQGEHDFIDAGAIGSGQNFRTLDTLKLLKYSAKVHHVPLQNI